MENGDVKYMPSNNYFIIEIDNELGHVIELNGNKIAEYNDGLLTTNLVCEIKDNKYIYYLPATSNYREYRVLAKKYEIKECNGRYFNPKRLGSGGTW